VQFVAKFSSLVMKRVLEREQLELPLLSKTVPRDKELRFLVFRNMVGLDSRACSAAGKRGNTEIVECNVLAWICVQVSSSSQTIFSFLPLIYCTNLLQ